MMWKGRIWGEVGLRAEDIRGKRLVAGNDGAALCCRKIVETKWQQNGTVDGRQFMRYQVSRSYCGCAARPAELMESCVLRVAGT